MAPATAPRSLVWAVAGPAPIDPDDLALRLGNAAPVGMWGLASASEFAIAGAEVAVAACEALLVVVPAEMGLDAGTARVWHAAAAAGVPRAVVVSGLLEAGDADDATDGSDAGSGLLWPTSPLVPAVPDFDELAVIAARMLGEECVPLELAVFGDDRTEGPVGRLSLLDASIATVDGVQASERAHRRVAGNARLRVLSELAHAVSDDELALELLARVEAADVDDEDADEVVWAALPGPGGASRSVEASQSRLKRAVQQAVAEGLLAPVLPAVDGLTVPEWLIDAFDQGRRLADLPSIMRRDAHDQPAGDAATWMVLQSAPDGWARIRPVANPADVDALPASVVLTRPGTRRTHDSGVLGRPAHAGDHVLEDSDRDGNVAASSWDGSLVDGAQVRPGTASEWGLDTEADVEEYDTGDGDWRFDRHERAFSDQPRWAPYRSWPQAILERRPPEPDGTRWIRLMLQPETGDALADGEIWLLPE